MRVVGEISHPECKITIFAWNNRYLIKLEQGLLEQTFKVNEYDVTSEAELYRIVDKAFLEEAEKIGFDVSPIDAAEVQNLLARSAATPKDVIARYSALGGP